MTIQIITKKQISIVGSGAGETAMVEASTENRGGVLGPAVTASLLVGGWLVALAQYAHRKEAEDKALYGKGREQVLRSALTRTREECTEARAEAVAAKGDAARTKRVLTEVVECAEAVIRAHDASPSVSPRMEKAVGTLERKVEAHKAATKPTAQWAIIRLRAKRDRARRLK
jgi:outer membrane murein-binding lipoprotein Lpp